MNMNLVGKRVSCLVLTE